ncbi:hypothetical protein V5O48_009403 [Marasmius crinis-equi]|uniref:FBD domain-containing protein n=1 Tax=Marasmius crinis-equi TaxID=585013 RepID=A0ABR3FB68_9AGAR
MTTHLPRLSKLVFSSLEVPFMKFFEVLPSLSNLEDLRFLDVKVSYSPDEPLPPANLNLFKKEIQVNVTGSYPYLPPFFVAIIPLTRVISSQCVSQCELDAAAVVSFAVFLQACCHAFSQGTFPITFTLTHHAKSSVLPDAQKIVVSGSRPRVVVPMFSMVLFLSACCGPLQSLEIRCPVEEDNVLAQSNRVLFPLLEEFVGPVPVFPALLHPNNSIDRIAIVTPFRDHSHLEEILAGCAFGDNPLRSLRIGVQNASPGFLNLLSKVFSNLEDVVVLFTESESFKESDYKSLGDSVFANFRRLKSFKFYTTDSPLIAKKDVLRLLAEWEAHIPYLTELQLIKGTVMVRASDNLTWDPSPSGPVDFITHLAL